MNTRRTLAAPTDPISGPGLFTAAPAALRILPAPSGSGLAFVRTDIGSRPHIPVHVDAISPDPIVPAFAHLSPRHTMLRSPSDQRAVAATTEHLLAALMGMGITDATLELEGDEIPHADGSARPFVDAIIAAGITDLGTAAEPITLAREVRVEHDEAWIIARPRAVRAIYTFDLDYGPGAPIAPSTVAWSPADTNAFVRTIAPARTFCLRAEAEAMRSAGLLTHLSPRDALVYGDHGPIDNTERVPHEPANHKLLDLIGDLALLARPLDADVHASRSGHALTHELCRAILAKSP